MQARVVTKVTIHAPKAVVFKYLGDTTYHHLWNPHLREVRPKGQLQLGDRYQVVSLILGVKVSSDNEVTKYRADAELEIRNTTGMLQYRVAYKLQASGKDTVLVCSTVVSAEGKAFAFARPVLTQLARRELQSDLQSLKLAAETRLEAT